MIIDKKPVSVAITGAAGQIGTALLFRIAAGDMLGVDQPVSLRLLDLPGQQNALTGLAMELADCAFDTLDSVLCTADPDEAFAGADIALLVGAKPRGPGMERADLLSANAAIFSAQGASLNRVASRDVQVVVVGNPANTNAAIAMAAAPDLNPRNFTALMRLDHNRAKRQIADKLGRHPRDIAKLVVWGNHSATQYPDLFHATVDGNPLWPTIDDLDWLSGQFIPTVQKRGAAIIAVRGTSSVASAADAAIAHVRDWRLGTPEGDWTTMAVVSRGEYGIPEGLVYGFPVICKDGDYQIVTDLPISDFSRTRMDASAAELLGEQAACAKLMG